ncbi:uncharacterized protein [Lepeophtheirus salmonis]|uniref:uncharacterized protein n=1 Tax=Lepeophtheirus salmonis TaxID=72036 RepID=UPI001AE86FEA|nr:uncharacterized protein LOC121129768 [Lepeophtheirus salmonis]XP_040581430.1 uncharacterized protein LOC121129771 [Lepeophtheirus salmonis]
MFSWIVVFVLSLLSIPNQVESQECNLGVFEGSWVETTSVNKLLFYKNIGAPKTILDQIVHKQNSMIINKNAKGFRIKFSEYSLEKTDLIFDMFKKGPSHNMKLINGKDAIVFLSCYGNLFTATYKILPGDEITLDEKIYTEKRMASNEKIYIERMAHSGVMFARYTYSSDDNNIIYYTIYKMI